MLPSTTPSWTPSHEPSTTPSSLPSVEPSDLPSFSPSQNPSFLPSYEPSEIPSSLPSVVPSELPSFLPSQDPSSAPSANPSGLPTDYPSTVPSDFPTSIPSTFPTVSAHPSETPSGQPSRIVCGCQPAQWEMKIDYSLGCPQNVLPSPGIEDQDCEVSNLAIPAADPNDFTFSGTVNVVLFEAQGNIRLNPRSFPNIADGETITYQSILNEPENVTDQNLPQAFLASINGFNAAGDRLRAAWLYRFTNECDVFPVISGGEVQAVALVVSVSVSGIFEHEMVSLTGFVLFTLATSCAPSSRVMSTFYSCSINVSIFQTIGYSLLITVSCSFRFTIGGAIDDSLQCA